MRIDDKGIQLIKKWEGLSLKAYKCLPSEKYWTIGYGHYGADVAEGMVITESDADFLLRQELDVDEQCVNATVTVTITQSMFNALVSFCFNCGCGAFKKSSILKHLNKGDYVKARECFALYNKSGGKVIQGLVNRRAAEMTEFDRLGIPSKSAGAYYNKYIGASCLIDTVFKSIGVPSVFIGSWTKRKPVAEANGIHDYTGTGSQNLKLIRIAKNGKLKRP